MQFFLKNIRLIVTIIILFGFSCKVTYDLSRYNFANDYQLLPNAKHAFKVQLLTDTTGVLHCRLSRLQLVYMPDTTIGVNICPIKIRSYCITNDKENLLIDSTTLFLTDTLSDINPPYIFREIPISFSKNKKYTIECAIFQNNETKLHVLQFNSFAESAQKFILINADSVPVFKTIVSAKEPVFIKSNFYNELTVCYTKIQEIAKPPFSLQPTDKNHSFDSCFTINASKNQPITNMLTQYGTYCIKATKKSKYMQNLIVMHSNYPYKKTILEMIEPLRYITTQKEYNNIYNAENPKTALDEFWLGIADNPDRARKIMQSYYNRIDNATFLFSDKKLGWKTDRGMIYTIFGKPKHVYKSISSETWIYGQISETGNSKFVFNKTNCGYMLDRSSTYKTSWYMAVNTWRSGLVYN